MTTAKHIHQYRSHKEPVLWCLILNEKKQKFYWQQLPMNNRQQHAITMVAVWLFYMWCGVSSALKRQTSNYKRTLPTLIILKIFFILQLNFVSNANTLAWVHKRIIILTLISNTFWVNSAHTFFLCWTWMHNTSYCKEAPQ